MARSASLFGMLHSGVSTIFARESSKEASCPTWALGQSHCNALYEGSDGHTYARYREPSETFASYENDALSALGAELDPIFARIMERGGREASDFL